MISPNVASSSNRAYGHESFRVQKVERPVIRGKVATAINIGMKLGALLSTVSRTAFDCGTLRCKYFAPVGFMGSLSERQIWEPNTQIVPDKWRSDILELLVFAISGFRF